MVKLHHGVAFVDEVLALQKSMGPTDIHVHNCQFGINEYQDFEFKIDRVFRVDSMLMGLCALSHGIRNSMEAILACHPGPLPKSKYSKVQ